VVRNILKYRQKGGRFLEPASLKRIYGLSAEKYAELEPYIRIPKEKKEFQVTLKLQETPVVKPTPVIKYAEGTLVDVGVADTTELKKIPGIGSGIAKAIVSYRKRLGGFYDLAQLSEIKYITPDMMKWFKLENPSVSQLEINKASLDKLRAHPYINFYQAKVIVEYRKKKGEIKSLSQLSLYEEFTEKDLKRLSAYLKF
ncbi:MAG: helix-hairpin-helix domain-containing protein, partial [Bacteroidaceae bacterium]|nr:helix-hairpin-helix domain-containing protein [Bacteroidaceae bacterium]